MLLVLCGLPATGKSFLARHLAKRLNAVHLNTDIVRREMVKEPIYSEEEKKRVYNEMIEKARKLLSEGMDVVLDGTFYRKGLRDVAEEMAGSAEQKCFLVECKCDEKTVKQRMGRRKLKKSESDADEFKVYKILEAQFEPIEREHLVLDCSLPAGEKIERVLKWVNPE